eukprot:scaffold631_cov378-Prasinococcus_capsulatus_cf.AAC.12
MACGKPLTTRRHALLQGASHRAAEAHHHHVLLRHVAHVVADGLRTIVCVLVHRLRCAHEQLLDQAPGLLNRLLEHAAPDQSSA